MGNYGNRSDEMREMTTDSDGRFVLHDLLKTHIGHEIWCPRLLPSCGGSSHVRKVTVGRIRAVAAGPLRPRARREWRR